MHEFEDLKGLWTFFVRAETWGFYQTKGKVLTGLFTITLSL